MATITIRSVSSCVCVRACLPYCLCTHRYTRHLETCRQSNPLTLRALGWIIHPCLSFHPVCLVFTEACNTFPPEATPTHTNIPSLFSDPSFCRIVPVWQKAAEPSPEWRKNWVSLPTWRSGWIDWRCCRTSRRCESRRVPWTGWSWSASARNATRPSSSTASISVSQTQGHGLFSIPSPCFTSSLSSRGGTYKADVAVTSGLALYRHYSVL